MRNLIFFILFSGLALHAQNTGFQKLYNRSNHLFPDFLQLGYESYVAGVKLNDYDYLDLTRLDFSGNVSGTYTFHRNNHNYIIPHYYPCNNCLQIKGEKLFYAYSMVDQVSSAGSNAVVLSVLHKDLSDTVRQNIHYLPSGYSFWPGTMRFDSDSTFILAGQVNTLLSGRFSYVAKYEENLQLLWDTLIPANHRANSYLGPTDLLIDPYGYVLIADGGIGRDSAVASLMRMSLDSGKVDWRFDYNGSDSIGRIFCSMRQDGDYQIIREIATANHVQLIEAAILDTNGTISSKKRFGIPNRLVELKGLIPTLDGNFYIGGNYYYGGYNGFGFKLSPQLDSLWLRPYWFKDSIWGANWIHKIDQRPDSLFIHASNLLQSPNQGDSTLFIFTTDRHGYNPFNQSIISNREFDTYHWNVFPNPSAGKIYLKGNYKGKIKLKVSRLDGQLIHQAQSYFKHTHLMNRTFKPGLYILEVYNENGQQIWREKILIR